MCREGPQAPQQAPHRAEEARQATQGRGQEGQGVARCARNPESQVPNPDRRSRPPLGFGFFFAHTQEDRRAWRVDLYFRRGRYLGLWGDLDPVLGFQRPLRDYWQAFAAAGFQVTGFEEPSITERGHQELPASREIQALRIPYSRL